MALKLIRLDTSIKTERLLAETSDEFRVSVAGV